MSPRPDDWSRVREAFEAALALPPDARPAYLSRACGGDAALRQEVEALLASHERANSFLETPAVPPLSDALETTRLEGRRLGPYQLAARIGAGGMGEVYRARDTKLGRDIAIKVLPAHMAHDPDARARFEREAHAVAALNHPHIVTIFSTEEADGVRFMTMELVEGRTLDQVIPRGGVALPQFFDIAIALADALAAAHEQHLTHRDLKPANVMVSDVGRVKVLDFGLARAAQGEPGRPNVDETRLPLTKAGTILGTMPYMSPEQIEAKPLDPRTDIFSLGIVLYEMATGVRPFGGESSAALISSILKDRPRPVAERRPDFPAGVSRLIDRCLEKQPWNRIQTATEILADLKAQRRAWESGVERAIKPAEHVASIAVLAFANMSADKENEYFSDGLAEEIINALAQMPGIKVAGRTSSFFFRGKDVEFHEIGRRLNVEHVLEGSVRKAGNRIRVTAQLIKVADGFHLWSERYDRELTDIFAIQDEITHAIAAALRIRLSPEAATLRRHEPNLRAYEAYLKSRDYWFKPTPESLALVKQSLEHAIDLDPKFALAHSMLGIYYTMLANLGIRASREVIPLARSAELEALRVDPSLPEAHALLGVCDGTDYEWHEAERRWRVAMAHEPVSRDIRFWYGNHYLLPIGRAVEAVEAMTWGLELDPLNLMYRHHLAVGLRHAGRLEDAEAELRKVLEIDENFPLALDTLGAVCAQQGQFEEALTLTEKVYTLTPWVSPILGQLAALLVRAGATSRADALIEKLRRGETCGACAGLALFHAMRGEFDRAAECAEQAIEERYPLLVRVLRPLLQSSPRWPALARLMNLP